MREELDELLVRAPDVLGIAGERGPAERSHALAEQGPDVERHKALEVEGVGHPGVARHGADVVAVVKDVRAQLLHRQHRPHLIGH